jgi:hypothetical protein
VLSADNSTFPTYFDYGYGHDRKGDTAEDGVSDKESGTAEDDISDSESDMWEDREGLPALQEYWLPINMFSADGSTHPVCALRTGIHPETAQPASIDRFNQHPIRYCRCNHPECISVVWGCNFHRGVLSNMRQCYWCERERAEQRYYPAKRIRECEDYPGDDVA